MYYLRQASRPYSTNLSFSSSTYCRRSSLFHSRLTTNPSNINRRYLSGCFHWSTRIFSDFFLFAVNLFVNSLFWFRCSTVSFQACVEHVTASYRIVDEVIMIQSWLRVTFLWLDPTWAIWPTALWAHPNPTHNQYQNFNPPVKPDLTEPNPQMEPSHVRLLRDACGPCMCRLLVSSDELMYSPLSSCSCHSSPITS